MVFKLTIQLQNPTLSNILYVLKTFHFSKTPIIFSERSSVFDDSQRSLQCLRYFSHRHSVVPRAADRRCKLLLMSVWCVRRLRDSMILLSSVQRVFINCYCEEVLHRCSMKLHETMLVECRRVYQEIEPKGTATVQLIIQILWSQFTYNESTKFFDEYHQMNNFLNIMNIGMYTYTTRNTLKTSFRSRKRCKINICYFILLIPVNDFM